MRPSSLALRSLGALLLGLCSTACNDGGDSEGSSQGAGPLPPNPTDTLNGVDLDSDGDGDLIVNVPASADPRLRAVFARYTALVAPSGGRVHILAQSGVSNAKLRRVRETLRQHLTPVPGTAQGNVKTDVFEALPAQRATLAIFRDQASASPSRPANAAFAAALGESALPLLATRIVTEGSAEYMAAAPGEDNTYGVTAALIYRLGLRSVRPDYADELAALAANALASGMFTAPASAPAAELDDAYVAVALDVHSGVFGHGPRPDGRGGNEFLYAFDSRPEMAAGDPALTSWIHAFFPQVHEGLARVEPSFAGTLDCALGNDRPYSHRAQYLRNIVLTGSNACNVFGTSGDDVLRGNEGDNHFRGREGIDHLIGGGGIDTAYMNGPMAQYEVFFEDGKWVIVDIGGNGDGRDLIEGIERVQFADQVLTM